MLINYWTFSSQRFDFIYLKYFYTEPNRFRARWIIYSLVFIRINEYFHLYSGQFKGHYFTKSAALIWAYALAVLFLILFFVVAEWLINTQSVVNFIPLAASLAKCSIFIFSLSSWCGQSLPIICLTRCYGSRFSVLRPRPAIEQALQKEYSQRGIIINILKTATTSEIAGWWVLKKATRAICWPGEGDRRLMKLYRAPHGCTAAH